MVYGAGTGLVGASGEVNRVEMQSDVEQQLSGHIGASLISRPVRTGLVLGMLCFVYVLNFLDRQLISILAKPIQDDLHITDSQLGMLTGFYFALFYCFIAVPIGWLADRTNRVRVLSIACALWSGATAACGMAGNYAQLVIARMTVGVGEAGGVPPSYAIISDYFPRERRGRAMAIFNLGPPLGSALGVAFGASLAAAFDRAAKRSMRRPETKIPPPMHTPTTNAYQIATSLRCMPFSRMRNSVAKLLVPYVMKFAAPLATDASSKVGLAKKRRMVETKPAFSAASDAARVFASCPPRLGSATRM